MEYTFLDIQNSRVVACLLLCLLLTASWQMDPVRSLGGGGGGEVLLVKPCWGCPSNFSGMKLSNIPYFMVQNYGHFISIFLGLEFFHVK